MKRRRFRNVPALVRLELLLLLTVFLAVLPLLSGAVQLAMRASGCAYLTLENISRFFTHPVTLLLLLLTLAGVSVFVLFHISAVLFLIDQSRQGVRVGLMQTLRFALDAVLRLRQRGNRALPLFLLFLLPFLSIGTLSSLLFSISIPEFFAKQLLHLRVLLAFAFALLLSFFVFFQRWLYALHYYILSGCTFSEAGRKSAALTPAAGRRLGAFSVLLLGEAAGVALHALLLALGAALILLVSKLLSALLPVGTLTSYAIWLLIVVTVTAALLWSAPLSLAAITPLFYRWNVRRGTPPAPTVPPSSRLRSGKRSQRLLAMLLALACGGVLFSFYLGSNPQIEYVHTTEVTAHRGASADFPENTMAAFEGARALGADWIELDVHQSRDGQLYVMHDGSFRRTTGADVPSWKLTYAQIRQLDAGSFFSEEFAGEPIPLLADVIDFAKEHHLRLNIELKPSTHDKDFVPSVVDLILEKDFAGSCVVASQKYRLLQHVKAYSEEISTVYVMRFAYGDISRLTDADNFSIEAGSISAALVSRVHNEGKQVYAWTVNSSRGASRMVSLQVDNIITDDPALVQKCIYENKFGTFLDAFLDALR